MNDNANDLAELIVKKFVFALIFILMIPLMIVGALCRFVYAAFLNGVNLYDRFAVWVDGG